MNEPEVRLLREEDHNRDKPACASHCDKRAIQDRHAKCQCHHTMTTMTVNNDMTDDCANASNRHTTIRTRDQCGRSHELRYQT